MIKKNKYIKKIKTKKQKNINKTKHINKKKHINKTKYINKKKHINKSKRINKSKHINKTKHINNKQIQYGGSQKICSMVPIDTKINLPKNDFDFIIYTTGLNDKHQIIPFYIAILKSAIRFLPDKIKKIHIEHYDNFDNISENDLNKAETELKEDSGFIKDKIITSKINIKLFDTKVFKDIDNIKNFKPYIIFDFAHVIDELMITGKITIGYVPVLYDSKPYTLGKYNNIVFGYYDDHDRDSNGNPINSKNNNANMFNIIENCKFFNLDEIDNKIETYRDRGIIRDNTKITGNIFGKDPSIFGSLSNCNGTKSVITIPKLRSIQEQYNGEDPKNIFAIVWEKTSDELNAEIINTNKILVNYIFKNLKNKTLKNITPEENPDFTNKCLLCKIMNCDNYESLDATKDNLCNDCQKFDKINKIYDQIMKSNPKPYHGE